MFYLVLGSVTHLEKCVRKVHIFALYSSRKKHALNICQLYLIDNKHKMNPKVAEVNSIGFTGQKKRERRFRHL
jgi:hypothetical protein